MRSALIKVAEELNAFDEVHECISAGRLSFVCLTYFANLTSLHHLHITYNYVQHSSTVRAWRTCIEYERSKRCDYNFFILSQPSSAYWICTGPVAGAFFNSLIALQRFPQPSDRWILRLWEHHSILQPVSFTEEPFLQSTGYTDSEASSKSVLMQQIIITAAWCTWGAMPAIEECWCDGDWGSCFLQLSVWRKALFLQRLSKLFLCSVIFTFWVI